jgi:PIN domain nuclease of toxin-antitoxin system
MKLLLDSHIFLWYAAPVSPLSDQTFTLIEKADDVFVSAVSIWELSIKAAKGKLPEQRPLSDLARACDFQLLPVMPEHGEAILTLPRHHGDPFDHLLLAQAKVEGLTLVTHDKILSNYEVPVLLV